MADKDLMFTTLCWKRIYYIFLDFFFWDISLLTLLLWFETWGQLLDQRTVVVAFEDKISIYNK